MPTRGGTQGIHSRLTHADSHMITDRDLHQQGRQIRLDVPCATELVSYLSGCPPTWVFNGVASLLAGRFSILYLILLASLHLTTTILFTGAIICTHFTYSISYSFI